jgi:lipopolysaccharide/colanic/teichoic acid biosynthesis glycosyltransferase
MVDTRVHDDAHVASSPDGAQRRRRRLPLGLRWLHIADFVVLQVVLIGSVLVRVWWEDGFSTRSIDEYVAGFLFATAIHLTVYYFGGLYEPFKRIGARLWLPRTAALTLVAVLLDGAAALLTGRYLMPRGNLIILLVLGSLGIGFNRWLAGRLRGRRYGNARVLLVGTPDDINLARSHLQISEPNVRIAGQVANVDHLEQAIERVHATDALLLSGGTLSDIYPHPLEELEERRIGVFHRISPADTLLGLQQSRQIAGMPFVALRAHALPTHRARFKRVTELAYLLIASPLLIVVGLLVALYVRVLAGPGIIHRQERVGRFGKTFIMVKFRTMLEGAENATGPVKASDDDPRIIRGMGWLRKSRLDEFPQFWNILKGDMSIVGPRPERPEFAEQYELIIPGYGRRHDIPPGLTGLAQVHGHYHTDPGFKLGHDLQYLVNWSPILDLQIMFRTVWTVLSGRL